MVLTMASEEAFFSLVCPQVADTQPEIGYVSIRPAHLISSSALLTQDDRVHGICSNGEYDHSEVSRTGVERRRTEHETEDGHCFRDSDVPCSLVEFTGVVRPPDGDSTSNEVRRAGKSECNLLVESESLDGGREEVLETIGSQVHVLHESEEPELRIRGSGLETSPDRDSFFRTDLVALHTAVREQTLLRSEPLSDEWVVWKNETGTNGDHSGDSSLDDEQPFPSCKASHTVRKLAHSLCVDALKFTHPSISKMPRAISPAKAVARMLPV